MFNKYNHLGRTFLPNILTQFQSSSVEGFVVFLRLKDPKSSIKEKVVFSVSSSNEFFVPFIERQLDPTLIHQE